MIPTKKINGILKQIISINFFQFLVIKYFSKIFWKNKKKKLFRNYKCLNFKDIRRKKKSDTVYIFGSGYSFNFLTTDEINKIKKNDIITFNWGHFQNKFEPILHLSRRVCDWNSSYHDNSLISKKWQRGVIEYFQLLKNNKSYKKTILTMQWEAHARATRYAVSNNLIERNREIIPYETDYKNLFSIDNNNLLSHKNSTMTSAINLAAKCGWKNIILTCINLDQGYFWLQKNKTTEIQEQKGNGNNEHSTTKLGIKNTILKIKYDLKKEKINLYRHRNSNGLEGLLDIEPN